jgi:hypothetical protein
MGEFTAISLLLMDINGITDFTKKSLQQYKMVVTRTRHNSTQGFWVILWVESCFLFCFIISWALPPPPSQLYVKYTVGGESNTIRHLHLHLYPIYGAACSFTTCSFCVQPQYQTLLSVFSASLHPPVIIQLIF